MRRQQSEDQAVTAAEPAGLPVRASLTIPCQRRRVRDARNFTGQVIGEDDPRAEVAVLLTSELLVNSLLHSNSGLPGGMITVSVTLLTSRVRVEVHDAGGTTVPHLRPETGLLAEHGRGLRLVSSLADRWGFVSDWTGLLTWFELGPARFTALTG